MKGQILLIDDSDLDIKIATTILESEGFACFGFTKHTEALEWLEKNTPTMIFLDLQMPLMTGYQLIPILKKTETAQKAPLIIISGKNQVDDIKKAISLGANDYLIKPIDAMVLQEKVRKAAQSSTEDFASVRVPDKVFDTVHIVKKMSVTAISEFGFSASSPHMIEPNEMIEIAGLLGASFEFDTLLVRCLSCSAPTEKKQYLMQFTFVGVTDAQRKNIRTVCRKLWIMEKGEAM